MLINFHCTQNIRTKLVKMDQRFLRKAGEELNKHIASVPILLIVLNYLYIVCLSIEINMFKLEKQVLMFICKLPRAKVKQ